MLQNGQSAIENIVLVHETAHTMHEWSNRPIIYQNFTFYNSSS